MKKEHLILIAILLLGAFFRLYGINWDQGQHLHPDERFMTMVTTDTTWPKNFNEYLDQKTSPLNPRNHNFNFFVYGLFPITVVKFFGDMSGMSGYEGYTIAGRFLSALLDCFTILFIYKITTLIRDALEKQNGKIRVPEAVPLFAAFLYAIAVLPIQLSHFYAVDLYVVTAITACFYLISRFVLVKRHVLLVIMMGVLMGIALGSKISSILFVPFIIATIGLGPFIGSSIKRTVKNFANVSLWGQAISFGVIFCLSTYLTLRMADPYMFESKNILASSLNPAFVANIKELQSWSSPDTGFPPAVQWITTIPILFPLQNILFYGMGIPLSVIVITSFILFPLLFYRLFRSKEHLPLLFILFLIWLWLGFIFIYEGIQFAKTIRYFVPLYPFAAILASLVGGFMWKQAAPSSAKRYVLLIICIAFLIWPVAFMNMYSQKHTRVRASEYIYNTIPQGSTISCEHWDDCLPVSLEKDGQTYSSTNYNIETLPLYDPDSPEKWQKITEQLHRIGYIILSSNRLYGSITSVPKRYPQTYYYYESLFNGSLGFKKVAEFTSRPTFPLPIPAYCIHFPDNGYGQVATLAEECQGQGIQFVDDYGDESFTVYDHPKVLILKNEHLQ